jgi:hypothetical protein
MRCNIKNNSDFDISGIETLIQDLFSHANDVLRFQGAPTVEFLSEPTNYGVLKKTAQYNPENSHITIYVDGRHAKDILRSMAHELVHHSQNEKGELQGKNMTQGEGDFDQIEGDAYLIGNRDIFRKWEDGVKERHPTIYNERRIHKMSIKDWKNKELNRLLMEKWGFGKKKDTSEKEDKKVLNEDKK